MTQTPISISDVSFDASNRRFNATVTHHGARPLHRVVSVAGDLRWGHQRMVRALLDAAVRP